ncbi:hypothetical protein [Rhizobium leucaenae]|jgi:hypothetical protein|uniref:Uncharacterized protein n=1 Tax=Rhizobium leucaenae TaxID=29450 RepID=A0A7W7EIX1_9HYPH|nr:hypothetical protein [Rhizobium leucaenae]MBB4567196.1 hypothetical protein [Rhizobium leucaenae]MBB6304615.1 hypothetical protein [Rhizobium leucaenae]
MRIVLIPGTMFVHIPFDTDSSPFNGAYGLFDWFRIFLRDSLFGFRLLRPSAISGVPPSFYDLLTGSPTRPSVEILAAGGRRVTS